MAPAVEACAAVGLPMGAGVVPTEDFTTICIQALGSCCSAAQRIGGPEGEACLTAVSAHLAAIVTEAAEGIVECLGGGDEGAGDIRVLAPLVKAAAGALLPLECPMASVAAAALDSCVAAVGKAGAVEEEVAAVDGSLLLLIELLESLPPTPGCSAALHTLKARIE